MSALLASVAAVTVLFTLLLACVEHLWKPAALVDALAAHRVVPVPAVVAAVVIASEGLLGGAGVVALVAGSGALLVVALAGSAALLALYGVYGLHVRSSRPGVPCGCSRVALPMTGAVVARAFVLAAAALVALLLVTSGLAGPGGAVGHGGAPRAVAVLAAASFALLLWHLPAALYDPAGAYAGARPAVPDATGGVRA